MLLIFTSQQSAGSQHPIEYFVPPTGQNAWFADLTEHEAEHFLSTNRNSLADPGTTFLPRSNSNMIASLTDNFAPYTLVSRIPLVQPSTSIDASLVDVIEL